jgi:hypothetical protein
MIRTFRVYSIKIKSEDGEENDAKGLGPGIREEGM